MYRAKNTAINKKEVSSERDKKLEKELKKNLKRRKIQAKNRLIFSKKT